MALVLTSPSCVAPDGNPRAAVVSCLKSLAKTGAAAVLSRSVEPDWFKPTFGSEVQFIRVAKRGDGEIVKQNAKSMNRAPHEFLVLAGNEHDIGMAKNGGAVLIGASWVDDSRVAGTGLLVDKASEFEEIARMLDEWAGSWFWQADLPGMKVRVLADLSTHYQPTEQEKFGADVTRLVKGGGSRLSALTALLCRSYLAEAEVGGSLAYGLFPSSSSANKDADTLSETVHAVRTVTSKVHFAKRDEPLLLRHRATNKRSHGRSSRTDPSDQINSLCVNPAYRNKLRGRKIVLVDDCTTYGLSFSVARTLLLAAGASEVMAIAVGKFGNQFRFFDIRLERPADCYEAQDKPFKLVTSTQVPGSSDSAAQSNLISVFTGQN